MQIREAANGGDYQAQLMQALGADSVEEAIMMAQAAGIRPQDVPGIFMGMSRGQNE